MRFKTILITLINSLSGTYLFSQASVNSGGSSSGGVGGSISISIGQAVNHFISSSDKTISAGVQQTHKNPFSGISILEASSFRIYPNPCVNHISIACVNVKMQEIEYRITDISGRIQQQGEFTKNPLDVSNLDQGLYIIKLISQDNSIYTQKIFKTIQ